MAEVHSPHLRWDGRERELCVPQSNRWTGRIRWLGWYQQPPCPAWKVMSSSSCIIFTTRDRHKDAMLCFMAHGLFMRLQFPYAAFPCSAISGNTLFPLVWEAVRWLEGLGLEVLALMVDGASPNRKFFKLNGEPEKGRNTPVYTKCLTLTVKNILHIRCASLHEDHKQLLEQCKSSPVCKITLCTLSYTCT